MMPKMPMQQHKLQSKPDFFNFELKASPKLQEGLHLWHMALYRPCSRSSPISAVHMLFTVASLFFCRMDGVGPWTKSLQTLEMELELLWRRLGYLWHGFGLDAVDQSL
jgi:hypothetical protein